MEDKKEQNWFRKHWVLSIILGIILVPFLIGFLRGLFGGEDNITGDIIQEMSVEEIKANALDSISYDDLMRQNEQYVGEIINYKGQVIQVQETGKTGCYLIRFATKKMEYFEDYMENILYVNYCGSRLLEGDILNLWIRVSGLKTYTAVLGNSITIPEATSLHVELIQKVGEEEIKPISTIGQVYVSAENFDADSEIDGLEFSIYPEDTSGNLVKTTGTVNAKLWKLECTEKSEYFDYCLQEECTRKDNLMIENWVIPITLDNYDYMGANIRAEYENYKPQGDKYDQQGCIEVTFITSDGKSFTSFDDNVYLAGF